MVLKQHSLVALALAGALLLPTIPAVAKEGNGEKPLRIVGGTKAVDLPEGSAEQIRINVSKGRFSSQSVDNLKLEVDGINYQSGTLNRLLAEFNNAQFDTVPVDYLKIQSGGFAFNTFELLNNRRFVLNKPTQSDVVLRISEGNLNRFLSHPKIIEKLEDAVAKKTGNIKVVTFSNPQLKLNGGNNFQMNMLITLGGAMASPIQMNGHLGLDSGKVLFKDIELTSQGTPLPVELAPIMETQLNKLVDFNKLAGKYFDISANSLKVNKDTLTLTGHATLKKLDIGL